MRRPTAGGWGCLARFLHIESLPLWQMHDKPGLPCLGPAPLGVDLSRHGEQRKRGLRQDGDETGWWAKTGSPRRSPASAAHRPWEGVVPFLGDMAGRLLLSGPLPLCPSASMKRRASMTCSEAVHGTRRRGTAKELAAADVTDDLCPPHRAPACQGSTCKPSQTCICDEPCNVKGGASMWPAAWRVQRRPYRPSEATAMKARTASYPVGSSGGGEGGRGLPIASCGGLVVGRAKRGGRGEEGSRVACPSLPICPSRRDAKWLPSIARGPGSRERTASWGEPAAKDPYAGRACSAWRRRPQASELPSSC